MGKTNTVNAVARSDCPTIGGVFTFLHSLVEDQPEPIVVMLEFTIRLINVAVDLKQALRPIHVRLWRKKDDCSRMRQSLEVATDRCSASRRSGSKGPG